MGLLDIFGKTKGAPNQFAIPSGSFTVDKTGVIATSTLPQSFPKECIDEIAKPILDAFQEAKKNQMPLEEIVLDYSALKITARELRGGAMVFLAPHGPSRQTQ